MKQTAVEWLAKNLKDFPHIKHSQLFKELIKQAKAMEKEQIIRAHLMARCYDDANSYNEAEQYYNETYEKNI